MPTEESENEYGPEFEVWVHLWSGIDLAVQEMDVLDEKPRSSIEKLGKLIANTRASLTHHPETTEAKILDFGDELLEDPWIRFAAEIEVASDAIARAELVLKRYFKIRPSIAEQPVPERAAGYVSEVIQTFAFGFDAACIALCRATLEQVLKERLISQGVLTAGQIRREQHTAGSLLRNANRSGLLKASFKSAEMLVQKGDTVMHRFIYEKKVSEQQALDSVKQLVEVLSELLKD